MEEFTGRFILLFLSRDFSNNCEAYMLLNLLHTCIAIYTDVTFMESRKLPSALHSGFDRRAASTNNRMIGG